LLSFRAESFVFQFPIQKYKEHDIQNHNFACCFVWVWSWVLSLREIRRLRLFENRVLRKTFGPKKDDVTGEWRRLHKKELYDLHYSPILIG
jgi:hypothetical protein